MSRLTAELGADRWLDQPEPLHQLYVHIDIYFVLCCLFFVQWRKMISNYLSFKNKLCSNLIHSAVFYFGLTHCHTLLACHSLMFLFSCDAKKKFNGCSDTINAEQFHNIQKYQKSSFHGVPPGRSHLGMNGMWNKFEMYLQCGLSLVDIWWCCVWSVFRMPERW